MEIRSLQVHGGKFLVGDRNADRVFALVERRTDLQPCLRRRVGDEIDDDIMADERRAPRVLGRARSQRKPRSLLPRKALCPVPGSAWQQFDISNYFVS